MTKWKRDITPLETNDNMENKQANITIIHKDNKWGFQFVEFSLAGDFKRRIMNSLDTKTFKNKTAVIKFLKNLDMNYHENSRTININMNLYEDITRDMKKQYFF